MAVGDNRSETTQVSPDDLAPVKQRTGQAGWWSFDQELEWVGEWVGCESQ